MLQQLDRAPDSFEEMLMHKPFLLDATAALRGFRSFRHAGQFSLLRPLPAARTLIPNLRKWHRRMSTITISSLAREKNYILDTNVLLHDPNSLLSFEEN